jgi:hypothetical protein
MKHPGNSEVLLANELMLRYGYSRLEAKRVVQQLRSHLEHQNIYIFDGDSVSPGAFTIFNRFGYYRYTDEMGKVDSGWLELKNVSQERLLCTAG